MQETDKKITEEISKLRNEVEEKNKMGPVSEGKIKTMIYDSNINDQFNANTITLIQNHNGNKEEVKRLEGKLEETTKNMEDMIGKCVEDRLQVELKKIIAKLTLANKERQDLRSGTDDQLPKLMEDLKATEKIKSEKERTNVQEKLCKEIHTITDNLFKKNETNRERREELDRTWDFTANELELKLNELTQDDLKKELINQMRKMRETVEQLRDNDEKNAENLRMLEILLQQKEAELARLKGKLLEDLNKFQDTPKEQVFSKLSLTKMKKKMLKMQLCAKEEDIEEKKEKIAKLKNDIKKENEEKLALQLQLKKFKKQNENLKNH